MTEKFVMSDNSKNGKKVVNKYSGQCGIRWNRMSEGKKKSQRIRILIFDTDWAQANDKI